MVKRLDLGNLGQPFDLLRAVKRALRRRRGSDGGVSPMGDSVDVLADRVVHVSTKAALDSEYAEVFAGFERFPFLSVYIHGSWADGTMTSFSDYDDLIIVDCLRIGGRDELLWVQDFLTKVDAKFCRMDPLQHHGHWIVAREDLAALDESYIPISVLSGAVCLQGEDKISYRVNVERSRMGFRNNIAHTCDGIEVFYSQYRSGRINLYEMKCLAGSFLIIPAYAFQSRGREISKPEAIRRAGELFSAGACSVLAKCTEMRRTWDRAIDTAEFTRFRRLSRFFRNGNMHRRYARALAPRFPQEKFPFLNENEVKAFVTEARNYANRG